MTTASVSSLRSWFCCKIPFHSEPIQGLTQTVNKTDEKLKSEYLWRIAFFFLQCYEAPTVILMVFLWRKHGTADMGSILLHTFWACASMRTTPVWLRWPVEPHTSNITSFLSFFFRFSSQSLFNVWLTVLLNVSMPVSNGRVKTEGSHLNPLFPGEIWLRLALYTFIIRARIL